MPSAHLPRILVITLTTALVLSLGSAPISAADRPAGVELLRDPQFTNGVTQGYANHLTAAERAECLSRWQAKGLTKAQWAFWEISELLHFAHHPETPVMAKPGTYHWTTANQAKQCLIQDGLVRLLYDTSKEWREGGRLDLPDESGRAPKYGNSHTTWPHFLIGQHFAADNDPTRLIPDQDKLLFDRYNRLRFRLDVKLNRLLRSSDKDHRAEFQAANHAIFYIAFVVMPKTASRVADAGKFYILVPAIYSEGDQRHVPGSLPWIGLDQFGDGVYFSGAQPVLRASEWVSYDVDVKQLIREAMSAATQKARSQGKDRIYRAEDYMLACQLIGWEVWGGFDTDVEFKNLSFRGEE